MTDTLLILLRALAIWVLIAGTEVGLGILRIRFLNRPVGDHRARQIGVGVGCMAIFGYACCSMPWIGARGPGELFAVGFLWMVLMLAFDLAFGRWVFRVSWARIRKDFDLRLGNMLALGMAFLLVAPYLAAWARGMI